MDSITSRIFSWMTSAAPFLSAYLCRLVELFEVLSLAGWGLPEPLAAIQDVGLRPQVGSCSESALRTSARRDSPERGLRALLKRTVLRFFIIEASSITSMS